MGESGYLRYPHIARDLVTFVAEDDVWVAPLGAAAGGGTRARRLTDDRVPVLHPRLNPSATHIAWTSTREGTRSLGFADPREVFAVPVDGGPSRQLTYWGDRFATVRGWVGDDEVLVLSRFGQPVTHKTWAFAVPLRGPARRLGYGPAGDVAVRDGAVLVGTPLETHTFDPARWKRYGGGTGGTIWYSPDGTAYERILTDVGNHLVNPMFVGPRVVFLSDHEGTGAIYSALPDGADLRRHTDLGEYYARHATTDGRRVVYQRAGDLWLLESLDAEPVRLDIRLGGDHPGRARYQVTAAAELGTFRLDPAGRSVAAEVRGTVQWLPGADQPVRALLAEPGVRARLPIEIPGAGAVICASDRGGEEGLDVLAVDGGAARRIGHGAFDRVLELAVAPDGRTAAVSCADGRLLTVALAGEPVITEIARSHDAECTGLAFSPDSALLAWAQPWQPRRAESPRPAAHIRLMRLADGAVADVTPPRFDESFPVFTLDGRHLAFLSNRAFDPSFDTHMFDFGFLPGIRPYLVPLRAITPSPFAPPADDADDADDADEPVAGVDFDGLADRIVAFPVAAGRYEKLCAVTGGVTWLDRPRTGMVGEAAIGADPGDLTTRLIRFDLATGTTSVEAEDVDDYVAAADGTRLAHRDGGSLRIAPVGRSGPDATGIDLEKIQVTVDPPADWRHMYHEAWRLMRDHYWRADMSGVDWPAMGDRYRPLLDRLGSTDDLLDVMWELQGELGCSHAGVLASFSAGQPPERVQGLLGADLEPAGDGTWRIARILPGESSVSGARSPLAAPGIAAAAGDLIVAVDGQPVDPGLGPNPLLVGRAGKPVRLTLRRGEADRRVVVVPLAGEHLIRYHDAVARQRAAVRAATGGRLGYLKLPNMMAQGWAEFHRDVTTEFGCDGLILDLRDLGGGDAAQSLIDKLARRVIGWNMTRHEQPAAYPADAPRGPIVAITDGHAMSGGDLMIQALKTFRIATVVGTRTWGGTFGVDLRYPLVDGTLPAQPTGAWWFEGDGFAVDNRGVEPDVEVWNAPHDYAAGRDPQLDTAVELALAALEKNPPATPPELSGPSA
ncbi:MAG: peptidase S41 [Catenulispora sp.]|nr:peptidase S41 [Catenulispora sp.]